jgi:hypothetical protein
MIKIRLLAKYMNQPILFGFGLALLFILLSWVHAALLCSILGGLWHIQNIQDQRFSKGRIKRQNMLLALCGVAGWLIYMFLPMIEVAGLFTFSYNFGLLMLNLMQMREEQGLFL